MPAPQKQFAKLLAVVDYVVATVLLQAVSLLHDAQLLLRSLYLNILQASMPLQVHIGNLHLDVLKDVATADLHLPLLPSGRH